MDAANIKKLIGQRVRNERMRKKLTQEKLGEKFAPAKTKHYISRLEHGKANPTLEVLIALAQALDIKLWDLVRPEGAVLESRKEYYSPTLTEFVKESGLNLTRQEIHLLHEIIKNSHVPGDARTYRFLIALFRALE